jgi:uncharacterized protein
MAISIVDETTQQVLAVRGELADSFFSRLKGLLGRSSLGAGEALVITQCNSIHMFFMKFPIDVCFLDKKNKVVGVVHQIKPFQVSPIFWRAASVIELPRGVLLEARVSTGDQIIIK